MRPDGPQTGQTARLGGTENVDVRPAGNSRPHVVTNTLDSAVVGWARTCAKQSSGSNTHHTPSFPVIGRLSGRSRRER